MRLVPISALIAAALVMGGCTGTGINDKPVYDTIQGSTTLTATVTDTSQGTPTSVTFTVDDKPLTGQVTANGSTFSTTFDSSTVQNGVHFVKAVAQPTGTELLNSSIFVQNNGAAAPAGTTPAAGATTGP